MIKGFIYERYQKKAGWVSKSYKLKKERCTQKRFVLMM